MLGVRQLAAAFLLMLARASLLAAWSPGCEQLDPRQSTGGNWVGAASCACGELQMGQSRSKLPHSKLPR
jgi:hypothetical protein